MVIHQLDGETFYSEQTILTMLVPERKQSAMHTHAAFWVTNGEEELLIGGTDDLFMILIINRHLVIVVVTNTHRLPKTYYA